MFILSMSEAVSRWTIPGERAASWSASTRPHLQKHLPNSPMKSATGPPRGASVAKTTGPMCPRQPDKIAKPPHQIQRKSRNPSQNRRICLSQRRTRRLPDVKGRCSEPQIKSVCQDLSEGPGWNYLETSSVTSRKVHPSQASNRLVSILAHTHELLFLTGWYKLSFLHTVNPQFL